MSSSCNFQIDLILKLLNSYPNSLFQPAFFLCSIHTIHSSTIRNTPRSIESWFWCSCNSCKNENLKNIASGKDSWNLDIDQIDAILPIKTENVFHFQTIENLEITNNLVTLQQNCLDLEESSNDVCEFLLLLFGSFCHFLGLKLYFF